MNKEIVKMAISSIGRVVKLDKESGHKIAESFKHPGKVTESEKPIKTGRIIKSSSIRLK